MRIGSNGVFASKYEYTKEEQATMSGVAVKSIILLTSAIFTALLCMKFIKGVDFEVAAPFIIVGYFVAPIATVILSFIMSASPTVSKTLAIPYAILEGVSIGCVCGLLKIALGEVGGAIVGLAFVVTLTFFLAGSVVYATGLIKVGGRLRRFAFLLGLGLILSSLVILIGSLINPGIYDLFYGNGSIALIFSFASVLIASVYSLITLDNAKRMVEGGMSKKYEWYCAFGIILNVIWLFWEILRLILIIFSRSNRN